MGTEFGRRCIAVGESGRVRSILTRIVEAAKFGQTHFQTDRQTDRHTKYSFVESGMEKSVESYIIKIDGHERKKFAFQTT